MKLYFQVTFSLPLPSSLLKLMGRGEILGTKLNVGVNVAGGGGGGGNLHGNPSNK